MEEPTEQSRRPLRFHLLIGPYPSERDAAESALRRADTDLVVLRQAAGTSRAEQVLSGAAGPAPLAGALLALRHDLRHGLLVHPRGSEGLVIRSVETLSHGRIMVRTGSRAVDVHDAVGLSRALSEALGEEAQLEAAAGLPYAASGMFSEDRNAELAAEALRMTHVFADPDFLRRGNPEEDAVAGARRLIEVNSGPRELLDLLLLTHGMSPTGDEAGVRASHHSGMASAKEFASRVETFVAPPPALGSQTLVRTSPDGDRQFLIALPSLTCEMMANLSWVLPTLVALSPDGWSAGGGPDRDETWAAVDGSLASYLHWRNPKGSAKSPRAPRPVIPMTMPDGETRYGPTDPSMVFDACALFLLARELAPILLGRRGEDAVEAPPLLFTAGLPGETRREVAADCEAYALTVNALILRSGEEGPYIPDFDNIKAHLHAGRMPSTGRSRRLRERARRDADLLLQCMNRTTEALLSSYAVADILAASARADGRSLLARQLEAVGGRREPVREYVLRTKREHLPEAWGVRTWHEEEEAHWQCLDAYVRHVQLDIVPPLAES